MLRSELSHRLSRRRFIVAGFILPALLTCGCVTRRGDHPPRFECGDTYDRLTVEVLDDDLLRCAWTPRDDPRRWDPPAPATPMIVSREYTGPREFYDLGGGQFETADLIVQMEPRSSRVRVHERRRPHQPLLAEFRPIHRGGRPTLEITPGDVQNLYGLGQQFAAPGVTDGDWVGRRRAPGCDFGNALVPFLGGAVGNLQIPLLFAVDPRGSCYGVLVDDVRAVEWDFTRAPWSAASTGDRLAWYVMAGADPIDARADYLELTGRPPVPPRKMFGLWVCEYGYDDWAELRDKLRTLEEHGFPVDGFILDLQWFGGIGTGSDTTRMGRLDWDLAHFPDPAGTMAELEREHGVGLMAIEESYVGAALPEFERMSRDGFLVTDRRSGAALILKEWWGRGGMVDWTHPAAADAWHDRKRQPLIDAGLMGHWCDLGEPENFDPQGRYAGRPELGLHDHADTHNLYAFRWVESIARGYERHGVARRPFVLSRSGTGGVQRFGAALWSGDIPSSTAGLAAHLNAQMHMCMSGIDYYGSDIGGFKRSALDADLGDLYTRWLADGLATDVPVRTHTANTRNQHETAPDRVGDRASNLANARLRYEMIPYYYSLAHRAWRFGEPVIAPLFAWFPADPQARLLGAQKMIGRDLMVAATAACETTRQPVYLPAGRWIDWHTLESLESRGEWMTQPLRQGSLFRLPLLAREGAIIPLAPVDEKTTNALGRRRDGSRRDELILRVFASERSGEFTLYEDDGVTTAYQRGAVRETRITQRLTGRRAVVEISAATGDYTGAPATRGLCVQFVPPAGRRVRSVRQEGGPAAGLRVSLDSPRMALVRTDPRDVRQAARFEFELEDLPPVSRDESD